MPSDSLPILLRIVLGSVCRRSLVLLHSTLLILLLRGLYPFSSNSCEICKLSSDRTDYCFGRQLVPIPKFKILSSDPIAHFC